MAQMPVSEGYSASIANMRSAAPNLERRGARAIFTRDGRSALESAAREPAGEENPGDAGRKSEDVAADDVHARPQPLPTVGQHERFVDEAAEGRVTAENSNHE